MESFLFLGFILSENQLKRIIEKDKFPQYQTYKFTMNLLKALECESKYKFTYVSLQPVSDYPYYDKKKFNYSEETINILNKNYKVYNLPFYNTSILKIISRTISSLYFSIYILKKQKNKKGIIIYSVHIPYLITGILLKKIFKLPIIGIWTDPPSVSHHMESKVKRFLRGIELKLSKYLMKKMDKTITLTKQLAEDFCPNKPNLVIEGIIDYDESKKNKIELVKEKKIKFLYTGSLMKKYGIANIVQAFMNIDNNDIELEIYGLGDFENELEEIALKDKRIYYGGFINNEEILKKQTNCNFLINARSPKDIYTKYSFPSKTLEYMLSGKPLISTFLLGMPLEYKEYFILLEDNDVKTIQETIERAIKLEKEEIQSMIERNLNFIKSKDYKNQGLKILSFLGDKI